MLGDRFFLHGKGMREHLSGQAFEFFMNSIAQNPPVFLPKKLEIAKTTKLELVFSMH